MLESLLPAAVCLIVFCWAGGLGGDVASLADNLLALLFQVYFSEVDTVDQSSPNFLLIPLKSILKNFNGS